MMEKHKCKLCFKNFSNGRALGGHMRSHVMNLHVPPKPNESQPTFQLSFEAESSSNSGEEEEEEDNKGLGYGLRENPKRSFRFADPEFSFAVAADTGSVIVQDRESKTESSRNVTRRRSDRDGKLGEFNKRIKLSQHGNRNESESSASDMTTEEDVAFCLMMMSRDSSSLRDSNWREKHKSAEEQELEEEEDDDEDDLDLEEKEEEEEEDEESDEYEEMKNKTKTNKVRGGRYKCETCNRVFRSYQALGGHRASHKKIRLGNQRHHEPESMAIDHDEDDDDENADNNNIVVPSPSNNFTSNTKKIHECPVCFRIFASGQALGGHKRTHVLGTVPTTTVTRAAAAAVAVANSNMAASSSTKLGRESLIDLNLPASVDDEDDVSQFEESAVSETECFKAVMKVFPR